MLAEELVGVRSPSSSSLRADRSGKLPAGGSGVLEDMILLKSKDNRVSEGAEICAGRYVLGGVLEFSFQFEDGEAEE